MARQTPEPSRDDRTPSGVTVDSDSLKRQQELVRTGSTSQEIDTHHMSPRTRSLRRNIASPKSSVATTPSASEPPHGLTNGRDTSGVVKDETPVASFQRAEMRSSAGLHGVPLDSASGLPQDGKARMHFNWNLGFSLDANFDGNYQYWCTHLPSYPLWILFGDDQIKVELTLLYLWNRIRGISELGIPETPFANQLSRCQLSTHPQRSNHHASLAISEGGLSLGHSSVIYIVSTNHHYPSTPLTPLVDCQTHING